ncbi:uncharacterized protein LOC134537465 [Bacillus rossius redtenbacheri]|uniref:uncharacterized protein LOC134537465 n=1 Tax=Bacillus rossius redtenbacheri TaxID=93214 RepID=UPI002FDE7DB2
MNNGQKSIESIFPAYSSQENPTKDGHTNIESFFPTYSSQGKPTIDGQKSIESIYPAYYDSTQAKPMLNGQRNAGAYALATFESQRNVQPSQAVALKTPLPMPNPYLTAPKPAIKAVPFASYPSPPQVYEVGPTPLKLSKAYPKKYRPELDQPKKPANLKAQYPLTKLKKQSAHHVAATKQAASFQDKGPVVAAKTSAPAVTKLSPSAEQSAAASGFAHTADIAGHGSGLVNHHDAVAAGLGPGHDRVEFQMYGHRGPHSYKFGFDTGKGHNRQFRFEERDPDGHVKGHYGFYSKDGKLQVISYSAHPQHGFHADGNFGKHAI